MKVRTDAIAVLKIAEVKGPKESGFADLLADKLAQADQKIRQADNKANQLLIGRGSIHETMIALEEAGIHLRMVGTVRDKVVQAYQELSRTQI
jgi:flagellar hook-basal body complex protein FliE